MTFPIRDAFEYFFGCKRLALWHRNWMPDEYRAVDIDLVGTTGGNIAYVIESTTSAPDGKHCTVTRNIAKATGARAFVVQIPRLEVPVPSWIPWRQVADHYLNAPPPDTVVVRQVYPPPEWQKKMDWTEFTAFLGSCRTSGTSSTP